MHALIRRSTASPAVIDEARPQLADLALTMRQLPGFVASSFVETADGLATITITRHPRRRPHRRHPLTAHPCVTVG